MIKAKKLKEIIEKFKRIKPVVWYYQRKFSSNSTCYHCGLPWAVVKSHDINVDRHSGFFVCCEYCWQRINADKKLGYAAKLHNEWIRQNGYAPYSLGAMLDAVAIEGLNQTQDEIRRSCQGHKA